MDYVTTETLYKSVERFRETGWQFNLMWGCLTEGVSFMTMLLTVDLYNRILKASKATVDTTPRFNIEWEQIGKTGKIVRKRTPSQIWELATDLTVNPLLKETKGNGKVPSIKG